MTVQLAAQGAAQLIRDPVLVALVYVLGGALAAGIPLVFKLATVRAEKRLLGAQATTTVAEGDKTKAEGAQVIVATAEEVVAMVSQQMSDIRADAKARADAAAARERRAAERERELLGRIESLERKVDELRNQLEGERALKRRIADLEAELAAAGQHVTDLEAELAGERDRQAARRRAFDVDDGINT